MAPEAECAECFLRRSIALRNYSMHTSSFLQREAMQCGIRDRTPDPVPFEGWGNEKECNQWSCHLCGVIVPVANEASRDQLAIPPVTNAGVRDWRTPFSGKEAANIGMRAGWTESVVVDRSGVGIEHQVRKLLRIAYVEELDFH